MNILRMITAFYVCFLFSLAFFLPEAFAANADILGDITEKFYRETEQWSTVLEQLAIKLFYWFLVIDISIFGIRGALDMYKGNSVASLFAEFTMTIFFASFMFACLKNYKEWSNSVIDGLAHVGQQLGYSKVNDGDLFRMGIELSSNFLNAMNLSAPITALLLCFVGIGFLIIFALIAAEIILIKVESYIVMNAGIFLLGFGGMRYFKDYSINFMKYAFTVAVKLFVLQLLIGIIASFFSGFANTGLEWRDACVALGAAIVMLALVKSIPSIISSLIMGANGGSGGNSMMAAAATIGGATMAAARAPQQYAGRVASNIEALRMNAGPKSEGKSEGKSGGKA